MLSVLFALFVSAAHAEDTASQVVCLDATRLQKINAQFKVIINTDPQGVPAVPALDPCDDQGIAYKLYQAIMFLEDLPALTIRPDAYDLNMMTELPYKFFADHVETIVFELADSNACSDGNAAAFVRRGEGKVMHICPASSASDLLYMATILIHESRHVDGFPHQLCDHGRWAGVMFRGCDPSYEFKGAYGIETEFNIRLARTETIAPEMREGARGLAVATFLENFNQGPFGVRKGLITQRADGDIGFFDGQITESLFKLPHPNDVVVMRANLTTVYGLSDGSVKSYLNSTFNVETGGLYAKTFRDLAPETRQDMRDVLYVKSASCFLTAKHLRCDDGPKTSEIDLLTIRPRRLVQIADYLAIQDVDGYIYTINPASFGTPAFAESAFTRAAAPLNTLSLVTWEKTAKIGIDNNGVVRHYGVTGQPGEPIPALAGTQYTKLIGPTWWSAHLADF